MNPLHPFKNPNMAQPIDETKDVSGFNTSSHYPWMCLLSVLIGGTISYVLHFRVLGLTDRTMGFGDEGIRPELEKSVVSEEFRTALLLSVVISIPMFVDTVLDCFYPIVLEEERVLWYSKALLLTSITIPNLSFLLGHYGMFSGVGYIFAFYYSRVAASGCTMAYASQIALKYQMKDVSKACLVAVVMSITGYTLKPISYVTSPVVSHILDKSSACARLLAHGMLFQNTLVWIRSTHSAGEPITSCEVVIIVKILAVLICNASYAATALHFGATNDLSASTECICYYTYIQMFYIVIIMTIPGRIARYEVGNVTRAMKERQAFIRYISHEIRTPLNTVFLGLEFVTAALTRMPRSKGDTSVLPIIDTVSDVFNSCEVAMSILNDLLTFDKMEGGKMTLELEYVNCCRYVSSLAKPFGVNAREKFITFTVDFSELSPSFIQNACIEVDHGKMGQVIRNLISNALKFTPDGGVVTVAVSHIALSDPSEANHPASKTHSYWSDWMPSLQAGKVENEAKIRDVVRVEIRDTGAGISPFNQTKLFGQYVQFNANKLQKGNGSGLGLWISKGITELHGGFIGVYSEGEGRGSTFHLELPVAMRVAESSDTATSPLLRPPSEKHLQRMLSKRATPSLLRPASERMMMPLRPTFTVEEGPTSSVIAPCAADGSKDRRPDDGAELDAPVEEPISAATLSEGVKNHLQRKCGDATIPQIPSTLTPLTPYPSSAVNPNLLRGAKNGLEGSFEKSASYTEYDFSSGDEDEEENEFDDSTEGSRSLEMKDEGVNTPESTTLFHRKHHSGISSVSSHSSLTSRAGVLNEKTALFGLAELLTKSLRGSVTETRAPKKNSEDFLASVHPFMITSRTFAQSLPSSRNSVHSSKNPTRYASIATTPGVDTPHCNTPGKYSSGEATPNAHTGMSTPLYSSPFNSPRTSGESALRYSSRLSCQLLLFLILKTKISQLRVSGLPHNPFHPPQISISSRTLCAILYTVLFADSWARGGLSNSGSRYENLGSIRELGPETLVLSEEGPGLRPERRRSRTKRLSLNPRRTSDGSLAYLSPDNSQAQASSSGKSFTDIAVDSLISDGTEHDSQRPAVSPLSESNSLVLGFKRASVSPMVSSKGGQGQSPVKMEADQGGVHDITDERKLHFMIVDDVLMNRRMVRRFLSTADYLISEAKDGRDCVRVWEEVGAAGGSVDVVLMDNSMPVMTGRT